MIKVGKWIAKHKILIIIIGIALLIPSYLGMAATRINYDVLSYLPDTLETVDGQDIMVDQFGMGAFSMIVVEDMELKDVAALKEKIEAVDHVKKVLWYDSVLDVSVPVEMLPKDLREAFFNGDATMMIALFDNTTSSETSMEAVTQIRKITSKNCFVSGMTGIVTDIKQIALKGNADLRCDCFLPFSDSVAPCNGFSGSSGFVFASALVLQSCIILEVIFFLVRFHTSLRH